MINLTDTPNEKAISLAKEYSNTIKVPVRGKVWSIVHFASEWFEKVVLKSIQSVARTSIYVSRKIDDIIEDKIGEESDIPDFASIYPIEQIIAMAVAYPSSKKTTLIEISEHFTISKRQAIRVKNEIENEFPSFPSHARIWEVFSEDSRINNK